MDYKKIQLLMALGLGLATGYNIPAAGYFSTVLLTHHARTKLLQPGKTAVVAYNGAEYQIYNKSDKSLALDTLDKATLAWLAKDFTTLFPQGINKITLTNSSLHKVAVVFILNNIKSVPRALETKESASKIVDVDNSSSGTSTTGKLLISFLHDTSIKPYVTEFPRFVQQNYSPDQSYWADAQLCLETIHQYQHGLFTVKRV